MRYLLLDQLKVKTLEGVMELSAGEVLHLSEDMARPLLAKGRIKPALPYLDPDGSMVIPFGSDSRYHWWAGGQPTMETLRELTSGP